ncbi:MAG: class I SAM-dependent methyltransferase [Firmicutes bacterium]|nr:class I SAM-dependent methyltransferase [Bacillota bacterium]
MSCGSRDIQAHFARWAATYDWTVQKPRGILAEVFDGYEAILAEVVKRVKGKARTVVDVGAGTGNLSLKCIEAGLMVTAVDPSPEMRELARVKLPPGTEILAGDFLHLPLPDGGADALVSTWAFHHVPDELKGEAVQEVVRVLRPDGMVVMADTAYESEEARDRIHERLVSEGKLDWLYELQAEYYPVLPTVASAFQRAGWEAAFTRLNRWVWLWEAKHA